MHNKPVNEEKVARHNSSNKARVAVLLKSWLHDEAANNNSRINQYKNRIFPIKPPVLRIQLMRYPDAKISRFFMLQTPSFTNRIRLCGIDLHSENRNLQRVGREIGGTAGLSRKGVMRDNCVVVPVLQAYDGSLTVLQQSSSHRSYFGFRDESEFTCCNRFHCGLKFVRKMVETPEARD